MRFSRLGFRAGSNHWISGGHGSYSTYDVHSLLIPYWFLIGVTAALPILPRLVPLLRRRRRRRAGRCAACGYDLRSTPHKDGPFFARCPECGHESDVSDSKTVQTERV